MTLPAVSVILPFHNQADHLEDLVCALDSAMGKVQGNYELILVPNGSTDNTESICRQLAETVQSVRSVSSDRGGWGAAVRTGLQAAAGRHVCYTNSARTSPQDLTLLVLYATAYPDVVVKANRKVRESFRRRLGSLIYNLECRSLFDLSYWDINGTPKVFPRSFHKLFDLERNDDLIDLEFNVVCRREGYPVIEVPIFSTERHGGKSTTSYRSALRMYVGAYKMWVKFRREQAT